MEKIAQDVWKKIPSGNWYEQLNYKDTLTNRPLMKCSPGARFAYVGLLCLMNTEKPMYAFEDDPQEIAKHIHMESKDVESAIEELVSNGVLERKDHRYLPPGCLVDPKKFRLRDWTNVVNGKQHLPDEQSNPPPINRPARAWPGENHGNPNGTQTEPKAQPKRNPNGAMQANNNGGFLQNGATQSGTQNDDPPGHIVRERVRTRDKNAEVPILDPRDRARGAAPDVLPVEISTLRERVKKSIPDMSQTENAWFDEVTNRLSKHPHAFDVINRALLQIEQGTVTVNLVRHLENAVSDAPLDDKSFQPPWLHEFE